MKTTSSSRIISSGAEEAGRSRGPDALCTGQEYIPKVSRSRACVAACVRCRRLTPAARASTCRPVMRWSGRWKAVERVCRRYEHPDLRRIAAIPEHAQSRALVERWRRGTTPWFSTWSSSMSFSRHHASRRPGAPSGDRAGLGLPRGALRHACVRNARGDRTSRRIAEMQDEISFRRRKPCSRFHTAVLMKEHGLSEIRTADADFHQFKFLHVVNPVSG